MTTTISIPEELLSTRVSWADVSDDEEEILPIVTAPANQWGKPLVIKKELQDKEPEWASRERKRLQKTNEKPKNTEKPKKKTLSDKSITCRSCKEDFVWTVREQQWFKEKGFTAPKTCKPCKILFKDCGAMPNHKRRITLAL